MVERIMEMTSENLNIDRALIQPTSSFKGDLGIDSLDLFELVMACLLYTSQSMFSFVRIPESE